MNEHENNVARLNLVLDTVPNPLVAWLTYQKMTKAIIDNIITVKLGVT